MSSIQLANQRSFGNIVSIKKRKEAIEIEVESDVVKESNLKEVRWIWDATIKILFDNKIESKEELSKCEIEFIKTIIKNPLALKNVETFIKESIN